MGYRRTAFQQYFEEHPECVDDILKIVYPTTEIIKHSNGYKPFISFPHTWILIEAKGISLCLDNAHHNKAVSYFNMGANNLTFSFNVWINAIDKTKTILHPVLKHSVINYLKHDLNLSLITPEEFVHKKSKFFTKEELMNSYLNMK